MENNDIINICPVCNQPITINQCGYHLDTKNGPLSLHVSCGEGEREVFLITLKGGDGGDSLCYGTAAEATRALDIMLGEADIEDGYTITKSVVSNNKYYSLR